MMAQIVSSYLTLQLVLSVGALIAWLVRQRGRFEDQLRMNYSLLCLVAGAFTLQFLLPHANAWHKGIRLWAAPSRKSFDRIIQTQAAQLSASANSLSGPLTSTLDYFFLFAAGMVLGAIAVALIVGLRDAWRLRHEQRRSFTLRRYGRLRIAVSERAPVAFSCRTLARKYVIVPMPLIAQPQALRLAIQHELQHHRQGDTAWVFVLFLMKAFSFWNPLVHFWTEWISEVQELACDEAMVDRKKADPQVYARCLAEAAQTALTALHQPVCATGFLFASRRHFLTRRIATMFSDKKRISNNTAWVTSVLVTAMIALSATAYASKDWVQDKRISLAQAQRMAERAQTGTKFPVVLNEDVLRELNRYLGTPEGREFIKIGLRRMQTYYTLVQAKIHDYNLPDELMAVPLVESGYRNDAVSPLEAAGIWQFIASTARRFGLVVNDDEDQRVIEPLETDAAMRYLGANNDRFKDWQLALIAYNAGEDRVQEGLNKTGTNNAWTLIHAGYEGDRGYLARIMAAVLILKNPDSVEL